MKFGDGGSCVVNCGILRAGVMKVLQVTCNEVWRTVFGVFAPVCTVSREFGKATPVSFKSTSCQMVGQKVSKLWIYPWM